MNPVEILFYTHMQLIYTYLHTSIVFLFLVLATLFLVEVMFHTVHPPCIMWVEAAIFIWKQADVQKGFKVSD